MWGKEVKAYFFKIFIFKKIHYIEQNVSGSLKKTALQNLGISGFVLP